MWLCKFHADPSGRASKAWVCGRSFFGIVCSNPARWMDICLFTVFCVQRPVQRANHSFRGILLNMVRRYVRSWSLDNEEAMARFGPKRHRGEKK